jgi:hypothetical protein
MGTVIAAPPPEQRELFCRNGLKHFTKIPARRIHDALSEIGKQRKLLARSKPKTASGKLFAGELDFAARMAEQSCRFMLWQQARAADRRAKANRLARNGMHELRKLDRDFNANWPSRNRASPVHCSAFLRWRINDYRRGLAKSLA